MYSNQDKIYLQTRDIPTLKKKIDEAINLSEKLALVLNDLKCYNLQFEIRQDEEVNKREEEA